MECGVRCGFSDWEEGDLLEAYELVEKHMSLEEATATTAVDVNYFVPA